MRNLFLFFSFAVFFLSCREKPSDLLSSELKDGWFFRKSGTEQWLPATVPGCVHTDLLNNKLIQDPFYRMNEKDLQWIDKEVWEYKTILPVSKEMLSRQNIELQFKGLDTYASIFINDTFVTQTDNMFREWNIRCREYLHVGNNTVRIVFLSPVKTGEELYDKQGYEVPVSGNDLSELGGMGKKKVSVYSRKAGYHYGWDWGPRLVSSGIWKPVYIKAWNEAIIRSVQIVQNSVDNHKAALTAVLDIEATSGFTGIVRINLNGSNILNETVSLKAHKNCISIPIDIKEPKLWWPNGYGEQNLYTIKASLYSDNRKLDEKQERIGLRTIELMQEPDTAGLSFCLKVNGVPMFMKGANYIPQDIFITRVTREHYEKMMQNAVDVNMNMIRVWGGGVYGDDILYDICDEKGLLVWQDFMFACSLFPNYPGYLDNIRNEARDNIRRIRNHASLALWCGNNECLDALNWSKHQNEIRIDPVLEKTYDTIFHQILPEAIKELNPQTPYWPSSPCAAQGVLSNLKQGDVHYWGVWWGKEPFSNYKIKIGRFMSEYGFQSFPDIYTVNTYSTPADQDIYSDVMKHHQRSSIGNGTIEYYMLKDYPKPKDFKSFLYVNHVLQAEGIKSAMEGHRISKPFCMGTLYWQIDDCWPVASWSGIDYYGRWKALHYYVRKAFEPVHVALTDLNGILKVHIVSDKLEAVEGTLKLQLLTFDGKVILTENINAKVDSNAHIILYQSPVAALLKDADTTNVVLQATYSNNDMIISSNQIYFASVKNLKLPQSKPKVSFSKESGRIDITLSTAVLAKNVYLQCEKGFFTDNYFDMMPGETRTVTLLLKDGENVQESDIAIQTLTDAFK